LSIKIGNFIESEQLRIAYAEIINNLYNVYYVDSRLSNEFYNNLIDRHLFGEKGLIDISTYLSTDLFHGKKYKNDFVCILFFVMFQDEQCYNYAINSLTRHQFTTNNERINYILTHPDEVPIKLKVFLSNLFQ